MFTVSENIELWATDSESSQSKAYFLKEKQSSFFCLGIHFLKGETSNAYTTPFYAKNQISKILFYQI